MPELSPRSDRLLLVTDDAGQVWDAFVCRDSGGDLVRLSVPIGPYRQLHFSTRLVNEEEAEHWRVWRKGVRHG
jgi:hypothetical protein